MRPSEDGGCVYLFLFYCCSVPDRQRRSSVYQWERVTSKFMIVVSLNCVREVEACCAPFCVWTRVLNFVSVAVDGQIDCCACLIFV